MDAFEKELKISFLQEADQILDESERHFLNLEKQMDESSIEEIFRLAHNIKGSASAVGFVELSQFMHEMESFLTKIKKREVKIKTVTVNLLLSCNDRIRKWVAILSRDFEAKLDKEDLIQQMQALGTDKYEEFNADHLLSMMDIADVALPVLTTEVIPQMIDETVRVALPRLEKLMNYVGELVILQTVLNQHKSELRSSLLQKTVSQLNKITKDIQDISMSLRMLPLRQTFQKMHRIVRDTSQELGKEVQFTTTGDDTEIDKTVIEKLGDPLVHLIRNAVDHGIESPEEREKLGKPRHGKIFLKALQSSGKIIIQIGDDGRGLNPEFLRQKAIEKGLLSPDVQLSTKEAQNLIFMPGFSTKAVATDISGRGVGMDVVKTNIETILRGDITVESEPGQGTHMHISLPLTLAIIEGMVVKMGADKYIVPLFQIHESLRLNNEVVHKTSGLGYLLSLRGEEIPLYRMSQLLFSRDAHPKPIEQSMAIVVRHAGASFAVAVDDIMGQQQVVIKSLGAEMRNMRGFSGGAILGDGKAALILDLINLLPGASSKTYGRNEQEAA
jgi:two-component system, chemotaxis family, sensor kinase CheA